MRVSFEVTAVLVEHALSHASREEELARQRTKDKIKLPGCVSKFQSGFLRLPFLT